MSGTGSSTGDETNTDEDVSLNDLSANHNNDLFRGAVAETCVDALAHMELAAESLTITEDLDPTSPRPKEETQCLLAENSDYHAPVGEESANLWNKAMISLAKSKSNSKDKVNGRYEGTGAEERKVGPGAKSLPKDKLSAYDMSHILDGSIHGGEAPPVDVNKKHQSSQMVASSEFSIDGESAILWGEEPEKAYFAYMLEQEAEHRALEGKDQDDSLMAESTRQELMQGFGGGGTSSFEEDDTTLGNPSKVFGGWDPSVVAGPSAQVSTLTPSNNPSSSQQRDKDGRLIIPNVIYVQDGTNPDPQVKQRTWDDAAPKRNIKSKKAIEIPEQARNSRPSSLPNKVRNKTKAAAKQLVNGNEENGGGGGEDEQQQIPKSGWYKNRWLICAALFFLILTTGLVAVLIVYRNHYVEDGTTPPTSSTSASANLDESGNPIKPPSIFPFPSLTVAPSPAPYTTRPTIDLFKKKDSNMDGDDEGYEDDFFVAPKPTWSPTAEPTWIPTWSPTKAPSFRPTWVPTSTPTFNPTTQAPTQRPTIPPTEAPSLDPTQAPSLQPTRVASDTPSHSPTRVASDAPTFVLSNLTMLPSISPSIELSTAPNTTNAATNLTAAPSFLPTEIGDNQTEHNASAAENDVANAPSPDASNTTMISTLDDDILNSDDDTFNGIGGADSPATISPSSAPTRRTTRAPTRGPLEASVAGTSSPSENSTPSPTPTALADTTALSESSTEAPTRPTQNSTSSPSLADTITLSVTPTHVSMSPTSSPSTSPAEVPISEPSIRPTSSPSTLPTEVPISEPSSHPTSSPSRSRTTEVPTSEPTSRPTTQEPSAVPTPGPSTTPPPTTVPTLLPTTLPPTWQPTPRPPTAQPTRSIPTTVPPTMNAPVPPYAALENVRNFILEYSPMSEQDLFNTESPQYVALVWLADWMANIPAQELGRITKRRLIQRWSMAVLYLSLNGPKWLNGSEDWMSEEDACRWLRGNNQGKCNRDLLVETIDLSNNNLRGTLPKEIANLDTTTRLEMDRNDITGPLPEHFGRLRRLVSLDFTRCDLTGTLATSLGNLQSLAVLGLGRNDFSGTIPTEIGRLNNLVYLGLERNDVGGTIPIELTTLVHLEYLALDWNALTGSVPLALKNLSKLRTLILARNALVGSVPDIFCQQPMDFLAADCDEVSCPCCDLCCENGAGCAST